MTPKIAVVIPIYNEAEIIGNVLAETKKYGDFILIVVDDGSKDEGFVQASLQGALTLRHKLNRGKGAAIKTGIMAANLLEADVIVTMDGDGQNNPADIQTLVEPILSGKSDVVLGSRLLDREEMSMSKVIANAIGNLLTWLFYGILVSDSQSGFRAYSKYAAHIIDTKTDKYEYDSKVISEIKKNRLRFVEVSIHTRYTEYSMGKEHKQGVINGIITLFRMVWKMIA